MHSVAVRRGVGALRPRDPRRRPGRRPAHGLRRRRLRRHGSDAEQSARGGPEDARRGHAEREHTDARFGRHRRGHGVHEHRKQRGRVPHARERRRHDDERDSGVHGEHARRPPSEPAPRHGPNLGRPRAALRARYARGLRRHLRRHYRMPGGDRGVRGRGGGAEVDSYDTCGAGASLPALALVAGGQAAVAYSRRRPSAIRSPTAPARRRRR